jgi:hypothetical protein
VTPSDTAAWFAAISATAGLIWTGVSQSRQRSARAQSEGAEQAGRLPELMTNIDLAGSDTTLLEPKRRALHNEQVHDLQRLIRLGSADFVARSLKPPVGRLFIWVTGLYSLGILVGAVSLFVVAGHTSGSEQLSNVIGGCTYAAIAFAGAIVFGALIDRRAAHLKQAHAAAAEPTEKVLARQKQHQP